jgi:hypothetical protein
VREALSPMEQALVRALVSAIVSDFKVPRTGAKNGASKLEGPSVPSRGDRRPTRQSFRDGMAAVPSGSRGDDRTGTPDLASLIEGGGSVHHSTGSAGRNLSVSSRRGRAVAGTASERKPSAVPARHLGQ